MRSIGQMLKEQELVVGLAIQHVCAPWIAKLYADAGSDFIFVEGEHMSFNEADLANLILSSRLCDLPVVAKSCYVSRSSICKLLDAGVAGIQLPMSESGEQLSEVVRYSKFPPAGVRAACPGMGNTDYEPVDTAAWLKQANEDTTVIAHIETRKGLENVDEILSVPGVDIMFVGTFDLSISLGCPSCFDHPDLVKAMLRLVAAAKEHGKVPGMGIFSHEAPEPWIKRGMRFFETEGDVTFIRQGAASLMKRFPAHRPRHAAGKVHP